MTSQYNNHYRTLLSIGIPIMIGQLGMIILSFADTMMVGHIAPANWVLPRSSTTS